MHYQRARLCQRSRAELAFNGLGQRDWLRECFGQARSALDRRDSFVHRNDTNWYE